MIAGIVMNILLAVAIYCGICYTWGEKYFANEDAVYGYTFNTAAQGLGFENGDKIISIDGEPIDDVNAIAMTLLLTESDRTVVVERDGREERFTIPFEQLVDFRRSKGYEEMLMLRTPFRIDSVASPRRPRRRAARRRRGGRPSTANATSNSRSTSGCWPTTSRPTCSLPSCAAIRRPC